MLFEPATTGDHCPHLSISLHPPSAMDSKISSPPQALGSEVPPLRPTVWKCPKCHYANHTDISLATFPDLADGQWKCVMCKYQREGVPNAELDSPKAST